MAIHIESSLRNACGSNLPGPTRWQKTNKHLRRENYEGNAQLPHRERYIRGVSGNKKRAVATYASIYQLSTLEHFARSVSPQNVACYIASCTGIAAASTKTANYLWEQFARDFIIEQEPELEKVVLHGVDLTGYCLLTSKEGRAAIEFAAEKHRGQMRKSGLPYVTHCIETARLLCCLVPPSGARSQQAVVAGVLHDVLDDTDCTEEEVKRYFGATVCSLVLAVTRLSQVNQLLRRHRRKQGLSDQPLNVEDSKTLRGLVLCIVDDPRVVLIKLADRLHNMRTLYLLAPLKQVDMAQETLTLWCSLAGRLGVFNLRAELEDICFAVLQPEPFHTLQTQLNHLWQIKDVDTNLTRKISTVVHEMAIQQTQSNKSFIPPACRVEGLQVVSPKPLLNGVTYTRLSSVVPFDSMMYRPGVGKMCIKGVHPTTKAALLMLQQCEEELRQKLTLESSVLGLNFEVQGRLKSLHSMHCKMQRKNVPVSQIYDARAIRVVVDDEDGKSTQQAVAGCYQIIAVIHRMWRPIPFEFDDYISNPKATGYQSLHTAVFGPDGVPLEVQLRTRSMHETSEYGKTAHWIYKEAPSAAPVKKIVTAALVSQQLEAEAESQRRRKIGLPEGWVPPKEGDASVRVKQGRLHDAVVMKVDAEGRQLIAAVARKGLGSSRPASREAYAALRGVAQAQGWSEAGQGGHVITANGEKMDLRIELFVLCLDGRYHLRDAFGHKHSDCTLLVVQANSQTGGGEQTEEDQRASKGGQVTSEPSGGPAEGMGESAGGLYEKSLGGLTKKSLKDLNDKSLGGLDDSGLNERVRLLRAMLEWEAELLLEDNYVEEELEEEEGVQMWGDVQEGVAINNISNPTYIGGRVSDPGPETEACGLEGGTGVVEAVEVLSSSRDVMVITWPDGKIHRLPFGSTVRDLALASSARSSDREHDTEQKPLDVLNVNNQMVPCATPLQDGDLVIIQ